MGQRSNKLEILGFAYCYHNDVLKLQKKFFSSWTTNCWTESFISDSVSIQRIIL